MRNSRLDRILYIQQVLVQGGVLNKQQTADRFGVSEKTIQRDLDTLRNHFADSEPRREILYNSAKGGYLLDDTLSRFLTSSEILAVCKILLESRSMVKEEMFPILDKLILACTPLDRLNQVKDLISNERFHYVEPQHGRKFIESLWEIGTAVENHNVMEITYCRTHDGETRVLPHEGRGSRAVPPLLPHHPRRMGEHGRSGSKGHIGIRLSRRFQGRGTAHPLRPKGRHMGALPSERIKP